MASTNSPDLPSFTITKLNRDAGFWAARVSVNGDTIDVDTRYGSWQAVLRDGPHKRTFHRTEVPPALAAKLQEKVRPADKRLVKRGESR